MEEKNVTKIRLLTFLLIITLKTPILLSTNLLIFPKKFFYFFQ